MNQTEGYPVIGFKCTKCGLYQYIDCEVIKHTDMSKSFIWPDILICTQCNEKHEPVYSRFLENYGGGT